MILVRMSIWMVSDTCSISLQDWFWRQPAPAMEFWQTYECQIAIPSMRDRPMVNRPVAAAVLILGWKYCGTRCRKTTILWKKKSFPPSRLWDVEWFFSGYFQESVCAMFVWRLFSRKAVDSFSPQCRQLLPKLSISCCKGAKRPPFEMMKEQSSTDSWV